MDETTEAERRQARLREVRLDLIEEQALRCSSNGIMCPVEPADLLLMIDEIRGIRGGASPAGEAANVIWVVEQRFDECTWQPYIAELRNEDAAKHKAKVWNDSPGAMANYRVVTYRSSAPAPLKPQNETSPTTGEADGLG